jgi:hypothetical protein
MDGAHRLVNQLVRLDRLPQCNSLEVRVSKLSGISGGDTRMVSCHKKLPTANRGTTVNCCARGAPAAALGVARLRRRDAPGLALQTKLQGEGDDARLLAARVSCVSRPTTADRLTLIERVVPIHPQVLFALQLFFNWLVVACTAVRLHVPDVAQEPIEHSVFMLSVAFTVVVSIEGTLNPKARWRQLRSSACSLQSNIWLYRTRAGAFELDESRRDSNRPEAMLCATLTQWRDDLLEGAGVKTTNLLREYPAHVYRHYQDRGAPPGPPRGVHSSDFLSDDFHSPTQPSSYIKLRIEPMMKFYAKRIPQYTQHAFRLKIIILLFGVTASVLARYDMLTFVAVVTAASSLATSWSEFGDASRKVIELCSRMKSNS